MKNGEILLPKELFEERLPDVLESYQDVLRDVLQNYKMHSEAKSLLENLNERIGKLAEVLRL